VADQWSRATVAILFTNNMTAANTLIKYTHRKIAKLSTDQQDRQQRRQSAAEHCEAEVELCEKTFCNTTTLKYIMALRY